jgi:hypothetical protein
METVYTAMKTPKKLGFILTEDGVGIDGCTVYRHGGEWRMNFMRFDERAPKDRQGYETWLAASHDLVRWEVLGRVMSQRGEGWDALQASGGVTLLDPDFEGGYTPEAYDGTYWMRYLGGALPGYETDPLSIGVARHVDVGGAVEWERLPKPVLSPLDADCRPFERTTLYKSYILHDRAKTLGARFVMYYNAKRMPFSIEKIGMALSDDMRTWRRFGVDFVVESGLADTVWHIAGNPQILRMGDLWVMHYFAAHTANGRLTAHDTFAASRDLASWTRWEGEPLIFPSTPADEKFAHKPFVLTWAGRVYHFYCAVGQKGRGLALAVSE